MTLFFFLSLFAGTCARLSPPADEREAVRECYEREIKAESPREIWPRAALRKRGEASRERRSEPFFSDLDPFLLFSFNFLSSCLPLSLFLLFLGSSISHQEFFIARNKNHEGPS